MRVRAVFGAGVLAALFAGGCATDPLMQLETVTPTLTPAQMAQLRRSARTAEALGIQVHQQPGGTGFGGINEVQAGHTVTVPLVKIRTGRPAEPGGQHRVPVFLATVNGRPGVRVLLDSGSNQNLFGYTLARQLQIPLIAGVPAVKAYGIGGAVENHPAIVPGMQIGSLELRKLLALVGPDAQALTFTRSFWGNTQVMVLGVNALKSLSYLSIDSLGGTVTFSPADAYVPDAGSKFVTTTPLDWQMELPVVEVLIDNKHRLSCVLDSGGDYGMLVPRSKAHELGYWTPGKGPLTTSRGIGGASLTSTYEIKQVKLGEAVVLRVPARTDVVGPEPAGGRLLLGNDVLRRYRVTFDFKRGMLWLER
jgi:hypothetical protein